jgi:hypothetical protein
MRPPSPVPVIVDASSPCSATRRRTTGGVWAALDAPGGVLDETGGRGAVVGFTTTPGWGSSAPSGDAAGA